MRPTAAGLLALLLASSPAGAACGDYDAHKLKDPPDEMREMAALQDCLHHTAVALSSGPDGADQVARAIAVACDSEIEAEAKREKTAIDAPYEKIKTSLTGYVRDQALLAVVKARTEKCSPNSPD